MCPLLIGRERQLVLLVLLVDLVRAGHGQIALVAGEAGIGHLVQGGKQAALLCWSVVLRLSLVAHAKVNDGPRVGLRTVTEPRLPFTARAGPHLRLSTL